MGKRIIAIITVVLIAVTAPFTAYCKENNTLSGIKSSVEGVISYKCGAEDASAFPELLDKLSTSAGTYYTDWYYIAFSQYGLNCKNQKSINALKNKVEEFYSGDLTDVKVTDMQRVAFALSACGEDITDINGHNLLSDATYNRAKVKPINSQGLNSVAYALLLLDSKNYKVPETAETTREQMIRIILKAELSGGGFALFGENPDIDITSIAMQALAPYRTRSDVKSVLEKCVNILSARQDSTGGYKSFSNEISCESTAQVILCLTSMGINPSSDSRFIKNNNSVMDGLNVFNLKSGAFSHFKDSKADNMATYQALCALVSTYRFLNGEKSFYDFTEKPKPNTVKIHKNTKKTTNTKSKNNSNYENKNTSDTDSAGTPKPTDKVKATKKAPKQETLSSSVQNTTTATEASVSETINNSKKETKNNSKFENKRTPFYIDFALLSFVYLALLLIKRRRK